MTVDSEAIFALAAHSGNSPQALEALHGSMAAAWLDERDPGLIFLARGVGRPLWIGQGDEGVFFASTKLALEVVEHYCRVKLSKRQLGEGALLTLQAGEIVRRERFRPNTFVEEDTLPAVRAPREREFCLSRLATIAAGA